MRKLFTLLLFIGFGLQANNLYDEKRVFGFLGDWHDWKFKWNQFDLHKKYVTDLCIAFAVPQSNGNLSFSSSAGIETTYAQLRENTASNGKRCHIAVGGWSVSNGQTGPGDPFYEMAINEAARANFIENVVDLARDFNLDGVLMDWEYPPSNGSAILTELMLELKLALLELEEETGRYYELSVAVSAGSYGSEAYNYRTLSYCDFVLVMAFDNISADHHSTVDFAEDAIKYWTETKNVDVKKIIIAIPLYSRGLSNAKYNQFPNRDIETYYYDEDGSIGNHRYNSQPMIKAKLDYGEEMGIGGAFMWELWDDRSDEWSLSRYIYGYYFPDDLPPVSTTYIDNKESDLELSVINGFIQHSWTSNNDSNYQLQVFDLTGKKLLQLQMNSNQDNQTQVPSNWRSGVYLFRFIGRDSMHSKKVLLNK